MGPTLMNSIKFCKTAGFRLSARSTRPFSNGKRFFTQNSNLKNFEKRTHKSNQQIRTFASEHKEKFNADDEYDGFEPPHVSSIHKKPWMGYGNIILVVGILETK